MNKNILAVLIVIIALVAGFLVLRNGQATPADTNGISTPQSVSNEDETLVRSQVEKFGLALKKVSLLAPTAILKAEAEKEFGPYVSPALLNEWMANPSKALGQQTSNPAPDHINIVSIKDADENTFIVEANVIETLSTGEAAAVYPVTLTLKDIAGTWLITSAEKGAYSELPTKQAVIGTWECLPVRNPDQPHTLECAFGIALEDGSGHLAVNTSLMSSYPVDYPTGAKVRIEGTITPVEQLNSIQWQKYDMKGIISATQITEIK